MNFLTLLVMLKGLHIALASRAVTIKGSLVMITAPLVESRFRRLNRPAILLGDMSTNKRAAIASVLSGCVVFSLFCAVLTRIRSLLAQLYYILTCD